MEHATTTVEVIRPYWVCRSYGFVEIQHKPSELKCQKHLHYVSLFLKVKGGSLMVPCYIIELHQAMVQSEESAKILSTI